jgi:D-threonate/D-erythronate kinase
MIKLLIISDDFTGALDTGVQFAAKGAVTYVMIDSQIDYEKIASNVEVLVIDAETRHLDKAAAYETVFSIVQEASKIGIPYIYKKTDSALRGNIGAELTAVLQASGARHIHFVPAFPQMGRTTTGGIHYANGVPIAQSVFGQDPFEPVLYSDIKEIIASQSEIQTHVMGTEITEPCVSSDGILVYDSTCNEDIENIAAGLMRKDEMHFVAGCAAFASILSKILKLGGEKPQMPELSTNMLVACGSVNPVSVAQCNDAECKGAPRFRLAPEQKLNSDWIKSRDADAFVHKLYDSCEKNPMVILDTNDSEDAGSTTVYAQKMGIASTQMRAHIMSVMGHLLERLIDEGFDSTILIMGGDSLIGFIRQAGIKVISPVCEMDCGVVLSQLEYNGKTLNFISKSGGFGKETLFSDLSEILSKLNEGK